MSITTANTTYNKEEANMGANMAAKNGHLDVLKWLAALQPPMLPNVIGANWADDNGHLEVLNWLASKGIYPNHTKPPPIRARFGEQSSIGWLPKFLQQERSSP